MPRAPLNPLPAVEFEERVRAAVLDSVRAHLLADVEVGIFLSAGVDSGALLGLMRDAGQQEIRAITLAFEEFSGTAEDEAPLAAQIAERYGAKHIVRRVSEQEFRDDLPAILDAMDQPSIDGVNTWFVSKAAKEIGLKVAISGLGGDELLAGYPSFVDVPRWRRRFGPLALLPGVGRLARWMIKTMAPGLARSQPKSLGVLEYANSWAGAYLLRRGLHLPHEMAQMMDPDFAREGLRRLKPLRRLAATLTPDPGSDVGRVCALESAHYMRNQLLRDADWAGMAHSLEIRVPLVDCHFVGRACVRQFLRSRLAPARQRWRWRRGCRCPTKSYSARRRASRCRQRTGPAARSCSRPGMKRRARTCRPAPWSRTVLARSTR